MLPAAKKRRTRRPDNGSYWTSFSDMLSSVLLVIMLAGNVDQSRGQLPGQTGGDRLIVDIGPGSPFPGQDAADNARRPILEGMFTEQTVHFGMIGADGEHSFNPGLLAVVANPGRGSSAAGQQIDGLQDDGFPGAGLAGQNDQPGFLGRKIEMKGVDQG